MSGPGAFSPTCICGRGPFPDMGGLKRHQNLCQKGKKHLSSVLASAKDAYQRKKLCSQGEFSQQDHSGLAGDPASSSEGAGGGIDSEQPETPASLASNDQPALMDTSEEPLPLSLRRTCQENWQLPRRFRDMLPEAPAPLPPPEAFPNSSHLLPQSQPNSDSESAPPQTPKTYKTQPNCFGLFRCYDKDSLPSNDLEDNSGGVLGSAYEKARQLSSNVSNSAVGSNPFYPYPNKLSFRLGDWYWNQGGQETKHNFKKLLNIIGSEEFQSEDIQNTRWSKIDQILGQLGAVESGSSEQEWLNCDAGWKSTSVTISVPFPQCSLCPGPKDHTLSDFYQISCLGDT
ncbi:hypothetical protein PAXINDRAFT_16573 [Paxillus involutus ATCC 200175]|uniref:Uncharacterized protein n=1 Tax=Paxillus involutus ATCC 200175 TaxID=664439 RepID=A0A0C9TI26_PAXIN|nr:hypothetical protein PAXINDRAFT_16573 [Paxillus involutus ATCC 200175]